MDNGPCRLVYTIGAEKMNGSGTLTFICVLACASTSVYLYMLYSWHFSIRSFVEKSFKLGSRDKEKGNVRNSWLPVRDDVGRGEVKAAFTSSWFLSIPMYHPGLLLGDTECKTALSPEGWGKASFSKRPPNLLLFLVVLIHIVELSRHKWSCVKVYWRNPPSSHEGLTVLASLFSAFKGPGTLECRRFGNGWVWLCCGQVEMCKQDHRAFNLGHK